jgi:nitrite reductase (NADH) large subunit
MKIVILGNGVAGISAAESVKAGNPECEIAMFSEENRFHYSRPRIIEYLAGKVSADKIVIKDAGFYARNRISLTMPITADRIDPDRKEIIFTDGRVEKYDRAIVATGAHSFLPPVPGTDSPGVFTLRTIDDADKIRDFARGKKTAIVIGGGLLGIESAMSLVGLGLSTTVVEVFDRLLPRQLDTDGAVALKTLLEERGLAFLLPRKTISIEKTESGLEVNFDGGGRIETDLVLFSAGVRGNLDIAARSGISFDKGIIVDERMSTNIPHVYAAGDVAQFKGVVYGIWPAARDQGVAAGLNAVGKVFEYSGSVAATKLKVTGIDLASIGSFEVSDGVSIATRTSDSRFERLFFKNGRLSGAILVGDSKRYVELQNLVKSGDVVTDPESLFSVT